VRRFNGYSIIEEHTANPLIKLFVQSPERSISYKKQQNNIVNACFYDLHVILK
jgi:hypothetical protein